MENSFEISKYLTNPGHALTIAVVGCGGTGSWVLGDLIALHHYLVHSGRPGLHITAFDDDIVLEANLGRQNFNEADLLENKAIALIEKYNRYWGLNWEACPKKFDKNNCTFNIIISCVDTVSARKKIINSFKQSKEKSDFTKNHLLIDCGNGYDYGQVIVTRANTKDKTFNDLFPDQKEAVATHSCSVLESLGKQNLFINKFIANLAVNWLYEALRNTEQNNLGYFFNFNTLTTIPCI